MANCNKCKQEIKPNWAYCPYCGKFNQTDTPTEIITTTNYKPTIPIPFKRPERIQNRRTKKDYYATMEQVKKESPNAYNPWTKQEEEQLTKLYKEGKKINEIAILLQRQQGGIRSRLKKIGLIN